MSQISFDPLTGNMISTTAQVAQLDSSGQLSSDLMPDEFAAVQWFTTLAAFPQVGVVARIYFSADNNVPHRLDPDTLSYLPIVADSDGGEF